MRILLLYIPTAEGHALAGRLTGKEALIVEASTPEQVQLALESLPPTLFLCDLAAPKASLLLKSTLRTVLVASTPATARTAERLLNVESVAAYIPDIREIESFEDLMPLFDEFDQREDSWTRPPSPDPLRYTLRTKLGEGATGEVWLARDHLLEMDVAIKVLSADLSADSHAIQAMKAEARIAMELSHSNIVRLYNLLQSDGRTYLVMEYIAGESIEVLLQRYHKLDPELVNGVMASCAAGLNYAHRHGVLHRDLKPSNLIFTTDDKLVIIDFGVASLYSPLPTAEEDIVGTPYYMSPEQLRGDVQGPASDQYSLGIIAYQMLTGALPEFPPFDPAHPELYRHAPLTGVSSAIRIILERATADRPENRYPSLPAFTDALSCAIRARSIIQQRTLSDSSPSPTDEPSSSSHWLP